jgi:hypothetical protein
MKNAAAALLTVTTLLTSAPVEARDRVIAGLAVSSTTAGLIASAQGYNLEHGRALYFGMAPAIFGYGYRATYYGNGFSYQPAYDPGYAYYVGSRFPRCCH